jgi:hypothetical protein
MEPKPPDSRLIISWGSPFETNGLAVRVFDSEIDIVGRILPDQPLAISLLRDADGGFGLSINQIVQSQPRFVGSGVAFTVWSSTYAQNIRMNMLGFHLLFPLDVQRAAPASVLAMQIHTSNLR